jgi:hypothetical protein
MAPRIINLSLVALASAAPLLAGCGAGSANSGVAHLSSGTSNAGTSGGDTSGGDTSGGDTSGSDTSGGSGGTSGGAETGGATGPGSGSPEAAALAFAGCMRANGVPRFPEPRAGGGFLFHTGAGVDPSSLAFGAAQTKCKKFLPPGPGSGSPPSAKTLAHYLTVARCMRRHGVPEFPDPRTAAPANPHAALGGGGGVISDIEGVIFVFPGRIDRGSAAFARAAAACAFPLHDHRSAT